MQPDRIYLLFRSLSPLNTTATLKGGMPLLAIVFMAFSACNSDHQLKPRTSGAGQSLDNWVAQRMDFRGDLSMNNLSEAFNQRSAVDMRNASLPEWRSLGPENIGGRTLCLAFHPQDSQVVYAGSASGGLWVTRSGGVGAKAWERVPLGHPVLGVSTMVIDPANPDRMWIGTGEMYSNGVVQPGAINRFTRGTYGIGILKTEDGGQTWQKSLDWSMGSMRGIQKIAINPLNSNVLYAATSEGFYRSNDGGEQWIQTLDVPMAVDIYVHPRDTQVVLITTGSFFTAQSGVYRSENGGLNFSRISNGIPIDYTGRTKISGDPMHPDTIYAYVADAGKGLGLFRTTNTGINWQEINATNVPQYQGWYSHALAVNPNNSEELYVGGIDLYRSPNSGGFMTQVSIWETGALGKIKAGGAEGPSFYVHADMHEIHFNPHIPGEIWIATDGGIFVGMQNGEFFQGRNGGYQTQQFYASFSSSLSDPNFAIGGLQDNGTVVYEGDTEWVKVLGGDGMHAVIDPFDNHRILAAFQNLALQNSMEKAANFEASMIPINLNEKRAFNGAYTLDPTNSNRVLAAGQRIYESNQFAKEGSWTQLTPDPIDEDNLVHRLYISPYNGQRTYAITVSDPVTSNGVQTGKLLISAQGGIPGSWVSANGLPPGYYTQLAFHPSSPDTLLMVSGSFGGSHLYRSTDGGYNWSAFDNGLPDLPTNTVVYDPLDPKYIYIGNDLGIYYSEDHGQSWLPWMGGLPEALLVIDLSVSPTDKTIRAATHGNGVFEADLISKSVSNQIYSKSNVKKWVNALYPIPARESVFVAWTDEAPIHGTAKLINSLGEQLWQQNFTTADRKWRLDLEKFPSGTYWLLITGGQHKEVHPLIIHR